MYKIHYAIHFSYNTCILYIINNMNKYTYYKIHTSWPTYSDFPFMAMDFFASRS